MAKKRADGGSRSGGSDGRAGRGGRAGQPARAKSSGPAKSSGRGGGAVPRAARYSPLELVDIVREVAQAAGGNGSERPTQAAWDAARERAGHPDVPRAHAITQRLNVSWEQLLRIAAGPPDRALRTLNQMASDKGRKGWDLAAVAYALRRASVQLGSERLNRTDYQQARARIVRQNRRGRAAARADASMPTLAQIDIVLRRERMSWQDLLIAAGLQPAASPSARRKGLDELAGVRAFIDARGQLPPTAAELQRWAAAQGHPARKFNRARFQAAVEQINTEREQDGQPALATAPPDQPPLNDRGLVQRWDREKLLDGLALAVKELRGREQLSQRALKRLARTNPQIPSSTSVNRYRQRHHPTETWDSWRKEAERRARSAAAQARGSAPGSAGDSAAASLSRSAK